MHNEEKQRNSLAILTDDSTQHITDAIVDLYSNDTSCRSTLLTTIGAANDVTDEDLKSHASNSPLSILPLENIEYDIPKVVVAQERNNIQALKRISLDASLTSDPDLPVSGLPLMQQQQQSLQTQEYQQATSPGQDKSTSASPSLVSVQSTSPFLSFEEPMSSLNIADPSFLWVPAHLHPEIAPKEWKTFVQERIAEIQQRSGSLGLQQIDSINEVNVSRPTSAGSISNGNVSRRKSRLSREIDTSDDAATGFEDGAEVLKERSKSPDVTVSDLEHLEKIKRRSRSSSLSSTQTAKDAKPTESVTQKIINRGLRRSTRLRKREARENVKQLNLSMNNRKGDSNESSENNSQDIYVLENEHYRTSSLSSSDTLPFDSQAHVTVLDGQLELLIDEDKLGSLYLDADDVLGQSKDGEKSETFADMIGLTSSAGSPTSSMVASTGSSSETSSTTSATVLPVPRNDAVFPNRVSSIEQYQHNKTNSTIMNSPIPSPPPSPHRPSVIGLSLTSNQRLSSSTSSPLSRFSARKLVNGRPSSTREPHSPESPPTSPCSQSSSSSLSPSDLTFSNVLSMPSLEDAISGDPSSRTDSLSVVPILTSPLEPERNTQSNSLKHRGKVFTSRMATRLFSADKEKYKEKSKDKNNQKNLSIKTSTFKMKHLGTPTRSSSAPASIDDDQSSSRRSTIDIERPMTADTPTLKKEKSISMFFSKMRSDSKTGTSKTASIKSKNSSSELSKSSHRRQSRSSSSLSSMVTDPHIMKSRSPSPGRQQTQRPPVGEPSERPYYYARFPLHVERAIYRLSHLKLANPRRPLCQQVLLSNFMYNYLELINQDSAAYVYDHYQQQNYMYQAQHDQHYQYGYNQYYHNGQLYQSQAPMNSYAYGGSNVTGMNRDMMVYHEMQDPRILSQNGVYSQPTSRGALVANNGYYPQTGTANDEDFYDSYLSRKHDDYDYQDDEEDDIIDEDEFVDADVPILSPIKNHRSTNSSFLVPGETYYETISRQQQERELQNKQFLEQDKIKGSAMEKTFTHVVTDVPEDGKVFNKSSSPRHYVASLFDHSNHHPQTTNK
ncbi:hypothetical protein V1511DRAFT_509355 [Dipodascopsis uninucleata]